MTNSMNNGFTSIRQVFCQSLDAHPHQFMFVHCA